MYKVLEIRRSTYYKKVNCLPLQREIENQKLDAEIKTLYFDSKKRYGAPKIHKTLLSDGRILSLKRVQQSMFSMGLRSIIIKNTVIISTTKRFRIVKIYCNRTLKPLQ